MVYTSKVKWRGKEVREREEDWDRGSALKYSVLIENSSIVRPIGVKNDCY